jgi:hypothetical protein
MQPERHSVENFMFHPACLAWRAATTAMSEAAAQSDRREEREAARTREGEDDRTIAPPARHAVGRRRAAPRLPLPLVTMRTAYAAFIGAAVTAVTFAWRGRARPARLDPAVGALRDSGLFVRSHAFRLHADEADGGDAQLVPAAAFVTDASQSSHRLPRPARG